MTDEGFRRYIGGGRIMPPVGQAELCADGITHAIHGDGGTRPMFEWLCPDCDQAGPGCHCDTDPGERP